jgi:hypothetical protein
MNTVRSADNANRKIIMRRILKLIKIDDKGIKPFDSTLFKIPENETPQLVLHDKSRAVYESRNADKYTCFDCAMAGQCEYAYDAYNTNGDCLAIK